MIKAEVGGGGYKLEVNGVNVDVATEMLMLISEMHKALASNKNMGSVMCAKSFEMALMDEAFWKHVNQRTYDALTAEDKDADEDTDED